MALFYRSHAVANGLHTDHPIPDLPFVDDSHLPLEDPDAIEALGRNWEDGTWGRTDPCHDGGWVAFTTDRRRRDLAWLVRWHPQHGRSVIAYRDEDAASAYGGFYDNVLLYRAGAYWWDGVRWYRPAQVFDQSSGTYVDRPVPAALTVTAADLLDAGGADASRGVLLTVDELEFDATPYGSSGRRWRDDLALWASRYEGGQHQATCVVGLAAPELNADQLLGVPEFAETGGIAASTLRAYLTRDENSVPLPQAIVGRQTMWSRPVAEDWAERRRRSHEGVASTMADHDDENLSIGVKDLWRSFTKMFMTDLWERPGNRKRFALRWRTQDAVRGLATDLGWTVAANLDRIIPTGDLSVTVRCAVLAEFADSQRVSAELEDLDPPEVPAIAPPVTRMLDWLIRHDPGQARGCVADIAGEARRTLGISSEVTGLSLRRALALDGALRDKNGAYRQFLELALPPKK